MRFLSFGLVFIAAAACSSSDDDRSKSGTSSSGSAATSSGAAASSGSNASSSSGTTPPITSVAITRAKIEVDYQAGAEPFTGNQPLLGDPWTLFKTNAAKLFEGRNVTIEVPTTLDGMEKLDDVTGKTFDSDAILAIAAKHRTSGITSEGQAGYYFLWLDGTYSENGKENGNVLGVSLGNTGVLAMFKPVITGSGPVLLKELDAAVEQVVLVHEFGHAVGLVNNGIPLASAHQDAPHGSHCTNTDCVMYWTVDGAEAARDYVKRRVTGGSAILFAEDCLADIRAGK
jgi:hypothetical protein